MSPREMMLKNPSPGKTAGRPTEPCESCTGLEEPVHHRGRFNLDINMPGICIHCTCTFQLVKRIFQTSFVLKL